MDGDWLHQVRIAVTEAWADAVRRGAVVPELHALGRVLRAHRATPVCTLDAFEDYVAQAEAQGPERFPLYRWTRAVLADPAKRAKHGAGFTLHVDGAAIYPRAAADALEAELLPLVGGGVVARVSRHDTDPDNNPQVPPEHRA